MKSLPLYAQIAGTLLVLVALCATPANAFTVVENVIVLSPDEVEQCRQGGGCVVITRQLFDFLQREATRRERQAPRLGETLI